MRLSLGLLAVLVLALASLPGCYKNEVSPNSPYDNPDSIPVPTELDARPDTDGINPVVFLQWPTDDSIFRVVDGFVVERQILNEEDEFRPITAVIPEMDYRDTRVSDGKRYAYRVRSVSPAGVASHPAGPVFIAVDLTPPGPPRNADWFPATGAVVVFWQPPAAGQVEEYRVYRTPAFDTGAEVAVVTGRLDFEDTSVEPGVTTTYRVSAVSPWRVEGALGNPVTVTLDAPPDSPQNLTGEVVLLRAGVYRTVLQWEPAPTFTGSLYRVYRIPFYNSGSGFLDTTIPSLSDATIEQAIPYTYWVTAVNPDGLESAPSTSVGVIAPND